MKSRVSTAPRYPSRPGRKMQEPGWWCCSPENSRNAYERRLWLSRAVPPPLHTGGHGALIIRSVLCHLPSLLLSPLLTLGPIRRLLLRALTVLRVHENLTRGRPAVAGRWAASRRRTIGRDARLHHRRRIRRHIAFVVRVVGVVHVIGVVIRNAAPPIRRVGQRQHRQEPGEPYSVVAPRPEAAMPISALPVSAGGVPIPTPAVVTTASAKVSAARSVPAATRGVTASARKVTAAMAAPTAAVRLRERGRAADQYRQNAGRQKNALAPDTHDCHLRLPGRAPARPLGTHRIRPTLYNAVQAVWCTAFHGLDVPEPPRELASIPQCRIEHNVCRAARRRLKKPGIGFIDDHRTHIGSTGDVIKAREFAEPPVSGFLLKPGPQ